jgi:hypothetical protein
MPRTEEMKDEQRLALKRDLAVIRELLALPAVRRHKTRFEPEVALVAPSSDLAEVSSIVERFLPPPVKTAGGKVPEDLEWGSVLDAMGGVREEQTLFLKELGDGVSLYVAYWPWGDGARFTIKVGIHAAD